MSKSARMKRRERQVEKAITSFTQVAENRVCLLCGGPAKAIGTWYVSDEIARRILVAPGKSRVIFYALCAKHLYGHTAEVERTILTQYEQRIVAAGPDLN